MSVIVLHGAGEPEAGLVALDQGADDAFPDTRPPREFLARVRALLRRQGLQSRGGPVRKQALIEAVRRIAIGRGLTSGDLRILGVLASRPGAVLSRHEILEAMAGPDAEPYDRAVDSAVHRLRFRMRKLVGVDPVISQRGAGYALDELGFAALAALPAEHAGRSKSGAVRALKCQE